MLAGGLWVADGDALRRPQNEFRAPDIPVGASDEGDLPAEEVDARTLRIIECLDVDAGQQVCRRSHSSRRQGCP